MKVYFRPTIEDQGIINKIKDLIEGNGHEVTLANPVNKQKDEYASEETTNILRHDLFVIEASEPISQAGFETAFAIEKNIPTIVLHKDTPDSKPFFPLLGVDPQTKLIIKGYNPEDLTQLLPGVIQEVEDYRDNRFTLNLTPQIADFLNWVSQKKKISRSDYVRSLIEAALKKNTEYREYKKSQS